MSRTIQLALPAFTLALLAIGATPALAAPAGSAADTPSPTWSVEPSDAAGGDERAAFAYAIDPGTQIIDYVAISNFGTETTTFDLYATDATNDFETGAFSLLPAADSAVDLGSWITVDQNEIEIAPGARAVVPITVLIPSDATPGDHTAGVIASVTARSDEGVAIEQRVAARVYLRVSGDVAASVEATGLTSGYSPPWNPFGGGDSTVDYAVTNTGNVRVDVTQTVVVRAPFGIELARLTGDEVINLLPGQSQRVSLRALGIPPVLLLWSTVTLEPGAPTDRVPESAEQDAAGQPVPPREEIDYPLTVAESLSGAVSWTLLALIVVVGFLVWLGIRYVAVTRQRMFDAIDEATARRAMGEIVHTERADDIEPVPVGEPRA